MMISRVRRRRDYSCNIICKCHYEILKPSNEGCDQELEDEVADGISWPFEVCGYRRLMISQLEFFAVLRL